MTNPHQPNHEDSTPELYASPDELREFVEETVAAVAVTGEQYVAESFDDEKTFIITAPPYHKDRTPSLAHYDNCQIQVTEFADYPEGTSVLFNFTSVMPHPEKGLVEVVRTLSVSRDGSVLDHTSNTAMPTKLEEQMKDIKEKLSSIDEEDLTEKLRSIDEEDVTEETKLGAFAIMAAYQLSVNEFIDEMEGVPAAPDQVGVSELTDLRSLVRVAIGQQ